MKSNSKKNARKSSSSPALSPIVVEELSRFIQFHSAARLSRNLRTLLLEFLLYDGSPGAVYLRDLVEDLEGLFSLLDAIESAGMKPRKSVK